MIYETAKLKASNGAANDLFGHVAVSGDVIVVGASLSRVNGNERQGAAYVFVKPTTGWAGVLTESAKLIASDGAADHSFGCAVAIDGNVIVIGAASYAQGAAYVFVKPSGGWTGLLTQNAKLAANNLGLHAYFGDGVAINNDVIVVGASHGGNIYQGGAYVFIKPNTGWAGIVNQNAQLLADDGVTDDYFGTTVAIRENMIVVGAFAKDIGTSAEQGAIYTYLKPVSGWAGTLTQSKKIILNDGVAYSHFGRELALSGDTIVSIEHANTIGKHLYHGSARVFVENQSDQTNSLRQTSYIIASGGTSNAYFGAALAMSGDIMVAGAYGHGFNSTYKVGTNEARATAQTHTSDTIPDHGAAYIYVKPSNGWSNNLTQKAILQLPADPGRSQFGKSVAVSGDVIVVGAPYVEDHLSNITGVACIYVKPANGWIDNVMPLKILYPPEGVGIHSFGWSIAMSEDIIVVGAYQENMFLGVAYVYVKPAGGWGGNIAAPTVLWPSTSAHYDNHYFGKSVAIDGDVIVVGAPGDDIGANTDQGSAYVFVKPATGWSSSPYLTESVKLLSSDGAISDTFGSSVAIKGDTVVVGAPGDTIGTNTKQGSAYIFSRPTSGWANVLTQTQTQTAKLQASDGGISDVFGASVAISNSIIVIGAPYVDVGGHIDQGAAYVFVRPSGGWAGTLQQTAKQVANNGATGDLFGSAVVTDGTIIMIGAPSDDSATNANQGSAAIFQPIPTRAFVPNTRRNAASGW